MAAGTKDLLRQETRVLLFPFERAKNEEEPLIISYRGFQEIQTSPATRVVPPVPKDDFTIDAAYEVDDPK